MTIALFTAEASLYRSANTYNTAWVGRERSERARCNRAGLFSRLRHAARLQHTAMRAPRRGWATALRSLPPLRPWLARRPAGSPLGFRAPLPGQPLPPRSACAARGRLPPWPIAQPRPVAPNYAER